MIGSILGDIAGSVYEFHNIKTKEFPFLTPQKGYTDDSILTLATADWLLHGGDCATYYFRYATRSPFRPNPLGLSSVRLEAIEHRPEVGPVLIVRGADLMDGTPIYDIKPYIPYADCHPDAAAGFTAQTQTHKLQVECPPELWETVPAAERDGLRGVLENDPRPSYQHDPERVYGMEFSGLEVHFVVDGAVLTVTGITRR
mgnify:CR=1 FL=1